MTYSYDELVNGIINERISEEYDSLPKSSNFYKLKKKMRNEMKEIMRKNKDQKNRDEALKATYSWLTEKINYINNFLDEKKIEPKNERKEYIAIKQIIDSLIHFVAEYRINYSGLNF